MTPRRLGALVCALALATPLAACSSSDNQDSAEKAVCSSLAEVKTAAAQVNALTVNSTVDQVTAANTALNQALVGLRTSAAELKSADISALESAGDEIQKTAASVSGSDTVGQAVTSMKGSATELNTAVAEMENGLQCS